MSIVYTVQSQTITRPADTTAYASGDLVANNTTAGSVVPFKFDFSGRAASSTHASRAMLIKSSTSITNAAFRLHLFGSLPVVTNGDNGVIAPTALASYNYLGSLSGATALGGGSSGAGIQLVADAGDIWGLVSPLYGLLEARAAYTPANAETFYIVLTSYLETE